MFFGTALAATTVIFSGFSASMEAGDGFHLMEGDGEGKESKCVRAGGGIFLSEVKKSDGNGRLSRSFGHYSGQLSERRFGCSKRFALLIVRCFMCQGKIGHRYTGRGICSESWVWLTLILAVPVYVPGSAWADGKLAELQDEQLGKIVEHHRSKST